MNVKRKNLKGEVIRLNLTEIVFDGFVNICMVWHYHDGIRRLYDSPEALA